MVKPVVFTNHARERLAKRGTTEADVTRAIKSGYREPAQRGLSLYRLTLEYRRECAEDTHAARRTSAASAKMYGPRKGDSASVVTNSTG